MMRWNKRYQISLLAAFLWMLATPLLAQESQQNNTTTTTKSSNSNQTSTDDLNPHLRSLLLNPTVRVDGSQQIDASTILAPGGGIQGGVKVKEGDVLEQAHTLVGTGTSNVSNTDPDYCPMLFVEVDIPFLQSCITTPANISYCNQGTAISTGTYIELTFPLELSLDSADIPYTSLGSNAYRFDLDTVDQGICGNFQVYFTTACDSSLLGSTSCIDAHIYPDTLCSTVLSSYLLDVDGACLGNQIQFAIKNVGISILPQDQLHFIIIDDHLIARNSGTNGVIARDTIDFLDQDSLLNVSCSGFINTTSYRLVIQDPFGNIVASSAVRDCSVSNMGQSSVLNYHNTTFRNNSHLPFQTSGCAVNGQSPFQGNNTYTPETAGNGGSNGNNGSNNSSGNGGSSGRNHNFVPIDLEVSLFPNPFSEVSMLRLSEVVGAVEVMVYDVTGRQVQHYLENETNQVELKRGNLLQGMYFYRVVVADEEVHTGKLSIK